MKRVTQVLIAVAGCILLQSGVTSFAQQASGLNEKQFSKHWVVESESKEYEINFLPDGKGCEIISPKGLTLWYKHKIRGNVAIEYDAIVYKEKESDRLSDLNCFWMATDPEGKSVFTRKDERNGVFASCAQMKLYYVGYGGNYNSTTRFRRYDGNPSPAIIAEYTDNEHLLKPNHWYHIKLVCNKGRVQYWIDGVLLFDYDDPSPYTKGWFGFRTTLSRTGIKNFSYHKLH